MTVGELMRELEREDPDAEVFLWAADRGYKVGELYAGEPGAVEVHAGDELEPV